MAINVGFFVIEEFSSICISGLTNALRSANRLSDQNIFQWHFLTHDDQPVRASDGMMIEPTVSSKDMLDFEYFFVVASLQINPPYKTRLNAALHRLSRSSDNIGAISAGAFLLARAGLLKGYDFTLHWENQPAFAEEFPDLPFSSSIYVVDRNRLSCAGGMASIDLGLRMIETHVGKELANEVANQFQLERVRDSASNQRPFALENYSALPNRLQQAITLMNDNMETPLAVPEIAHEVGTTVRSLERLFKKYLGAAPATFYRRIRLERARHLLWHTNLSVLDISFLTGFSSPSYLSRMYQNQYGKMPSQERS